MISKKKTINSAEIEKINYYPDAQVNCSCGAKFFVGSTVENIHVEVCSNCHPYYTGSQKLVDTSGRVDKFKERMAKKEVMLKKLKDTKKPTHKAEKITTPKRKETK